MEKLSSESNMVYELRSLIGCETPLTWTNYLCLQQETYFRWKTKDSSYETSWIQRSDACQLTWAQVSRKSEALESISSSSKTSFLAYRWSKVTVEEETSTTILLNYEYQVNKPCQQLQLLRGIKTVFHLLSTGSSNFSNNVMLGNVEFWHVGNGDVANPQNIKDIS